MVSYWMLYAELSSTGMVSYWLLYAELSSTGVVSYWMLYAEFYWCGQLLAVVHRVLLVWSVTGCCTLS